MNGGVFEKKAALTKDVLGWIVAAAYAGYTLTACVVWRQVRKDRMDGKRGEEVRLIR